MMLRRAAAALLCTITAASLLTSCGVKDGSGEAGSSSKAGSESTASHDVNIDRFGDR